MVACRWTSVKAVRARTVGCAQLWRLVTHAPALSDTQAGTANSSATTVTPAPARTEDLVSRSMVEATSASVHQVRIFVFELNKMYKMMMFKIICLRIVFKLKIKK